MSILDFIEIGVAGVGSYSQVKIVKRNKDGKTYALKETSLKQNNVQGICNFMNEIRVLSSITHPNIIQFQQSSYDEKTQRLYLLMEYANGGSISNLINNHQSQGTFIDQERIWEISSQILAALQVLHKIGVIHRDIKSSNILITDGIAKICDFNSCKIIEDSVTWTEVGTPLYASPQMWDGQIYSAKCDVWSFGCVVYELSSLNSPFSGANNQQISSKIRNGTYPRIPLRYTNKLSDFIAKCLTLNQNKRADVESLLEIARTVIGQPPIKTKKSKLIQNILRPQIIIPEKLCFLNDYLPKIRLSQPLTARNVIRKVKKRKTVRQDNCKSVPKYSQLTRVKSQNNIVQNYGLEKKQKLWQKQPKTELRTKIKESHKTQISQLTIKNKNMSHHQDEQKTLRIFKSPKIHKHQSSLAKIKTQKTK